MRTLGIASAALAFAARRIPAGDRNRLSALGQLKQLLGTVLGDSPLAQSYDAN
jgi:hypothetical protein